MSENGAPTVTTDPIDVRNSRLEDESDGEFESGEQFRQYAEQSATMSVSDDDVLALFQEFEKIVLEGMGKLPTGCVGINTRFDTLRLSDDVGDRARGFEKIAPFIAPKSRKLGLKLTNAPFSDGGRNMSLRRNQKKNGAYSDGAVVSIKSWIQNSSPLQDGKRIKDWFQDNLPQQGPCFYSTEFLQDGHGNDWLVVDLDDPVQ